MTTTNKIKSKNKVYDGFFPINILEIENLDGKTVKREQIKLHDAVAGLIYNTLENKFIFVKQFRVGPEDFILEIPAGKMDIEGETPENALEREILEEIGYKSDRIEKIIDYYPSPGSSTEKIHLFFVEVSEKIEDGGGVGTEEIEIVEISNSEIYNFYKEGKFKDGKTILSILTKLKQV